MEGAGGDVVAEAEGMEAGSQLSRRLAGEGQRQRVARVEVADGRPVGDAQVRTRVFPDPAPAWTQSGLAGLVTASR
jgi:hypothetical protein